jgi:hypothetical protein
LRCQGSPPLQRWWPPCLQAWAQTRGTGMHLSSKGGTSLLLSRAHLSSLLILECSCASWRKRAGTTLATRRPNSARVQSMPLAPSRDSRFPRPTQQSACFERASAGRRRQSEARSLQFSQRSSQSHRRQYLTPPRCSHLRAGLGPLNRTQNCDLRLHPATCGSYQRLACAMTACRKHRSVTSFCSPTRQSLPYLAPRRTLPWKARRP